MRLSVGWLALLLLLLMCLLMAAILPTQSSTHTQQGNYEKQEGFVELSNELSIGTCPANSSMYVDKLTGVRMCCDGSLADGKCAGRIICAVAPQAKSGIPSCSEYRFAYLEQKGADRCPPGMGRYFEDPKTGVRGCCAGPRNLEGTAPRDPNDRRCRLYPTQTEERTRADSCYNAKGPAAWPLSRFQEEFEKAGCTRTLTEADTGWWRKQNSTAVLADMGTYARLSAGCRGTRDQHEFCAPGKCLPPQASPPPPMRPVPIPQIAAPVGATPPQSKKMKELTREEYNRFWDSTGCEGKLQVRPGLGWTKFSSEELRQTTINGEKNSEVIVDEATKILKNMCSNSPSTVPDNVFLKDISMDLFKDIWNQTGCEGKKESNKPITFKFAELGQLIKDKNGDEAVGRWREGIRNYCSQLEMA